MIQSRNLARKPCLASSRRQAISGAELFLYQPHTLRRHRASPRYVIGRSNYCLRIAAIHNGIWLNKITFDPSSVFPCSSHSFSCISRFLATESLRRARHQRRRPEETTTRQLIHRLRRASVKSEPRLLHFSSPHMRPAAVYKRQYICIMFGRIS